MSSAAAAAAASSLAAAPASPQQPPVPSAPTTTTTTTTTTASSNIVDERTAALALRPDVDAYFANLYTAARAGATPRQSCAEDKPPGLELWEQTKRALALPPRTSTVRWDPQAFADSSERAIAALTAAVEAGARSRQAAAAASAALTATAAYAPPAPDEQSAKRVALDAAAVQQHHQHQHAASASPSASTPAHVHEDASGRYCIAPIAGLPHMLSVTAAPPAASAAPPPTPAPKSVLVDSGCGSACLRGADVYLPGLLGVERGLQQHERVGVWADLDGSNPAGHSGPFTGRRRFVGNGVLALPRTELLRGIAQKHSGVAVHMTEPLYAAPSFEHCGPDLVPQNLPSYLAVHNLRVAPGQLVLDMCAAPGGKTTHIAADLRGRGCVVALERQAKRAAALQATVAPYGPTVVALKRDSTKILDDRAPAPTPQTLQGLAPDTKISFPSRSFDRVLLDAPCSGLGQRPRMKHDMSLVDAQQYGVFQKKLIGVAARLVKPGGLLTYSTCSVSPSENEQVVAFALATFPFLELVEPDPQLAEPGLPNQGLDEDLLPLVQRFEPGAALDTIGFFVATFRVKEE